MNPAPVDINEWISKTNRRLAIVERQAGRSREQGQIRLTDTTDASLTSTEHAFQIGADAETNLIMDANEIMVRNNGAAGGLVLQDDGGTLRLGGTATAVEIPSWIKWWSVQQSSAQAIPNTTWTTINPWASIRNDNGGITYSAGVFTVPVSGWYFLHGQVRFVSSGTQGGQRTCRLNINNGSSTIEGMGNIPTAGVSGGSDVTTAKFLTAGDTVRFDVYQSQGATLNTIPGETYTALQIGLLMGV